MEVLIATTMTNPEIIGAQNDLWQHRDRQVGRFCCWIDGKSTGRPVGPRGPRAHPHGVQGEQSSPTAAREACGRQSGRPHTGRF